ncbi:hypothetical protein P3W85_28350 [Cupriavidus basilensis]|uniref:Flagellar basal body rod protein FlgB n=1 Tax=Cupriavidus basilensis TaxID=68895 RepID=A0ABT6AX63_9BURK|nr:hypothetical protein [Cupriavidus basilensis]MDF3836832.1 hypothetical protein [Cupriavidus basilensis]
MALTTELVGKVLDGLFARQITHAQNIANVTAERPQFHAVSFEQELSALMREPASESERLARIRGFQPIVTLVAQPAQGDFRADLEVSKAGENTLRYQMLVSMLDRTLQLHHSALTEGRSR